MSGPSQACHARGRVAGAVGLCIAASLVLAGCAGDGSKDDASALRAENAQLRTENLQKQQELDQLRTNSPRNAKPAAYEGSPTNTNEFGPNTTATRGGGEIIVEIAGDVLFDSGAIVLKASSKSTLNRVASVIQDRYSSNRIRVEGYTDSDPIKKSGYESNEALSAKRALAVEKYLVSRGVSPDAIYSAAMGAANPKGTKKASRRVEIVILGTN